MTALRNLYTSVGSFVAEENGKNTHRKLPICFGSKLGHECQELAFAVLNASIPLPVPSQPVIGSRSNQPADNASEHQFYGLKDDLVECIQYLIVAIIAGFTASYYTRKPRGN